MNDSECDSNTHINDNEQKYPMQWEQVFISRILMALIGLFLVIIGISLSNERGFVLIIIGVILLLSSIIGKMLLRSIRL